MNSKLISILSKLTVAGVIGVVVFLFFKYDLQTHITFANLKAQKDVLAQFYADNRLLTILVYSAGYIIMAALSLPGAAIMTMAGGALFGLWVGGAAALISSTIGATLAFLIARFLLGNYVQSKFSDRLEKINKGIKDDGAFYLFTLRLVPIFPFFIINLVMGLTPIRTSVFFLVSLVGMLPGGLVYVNAGSQLSRINSPGDILSLNLLLSFALLGIFPWIAKAITSFLKNRQALSRFKKPSKFDYNLVVIGGGSAGLVTSYIASMVRAKVLLIEKDKMGGDCLNTGCVPSKALLRSAKMLSYAKRAKDFGFNKAEVDFNFSLVMNRVHAIIKQIEPNDSIERYTKLGVDCIIGEATVVSPYEVVVNDKKITTRSIVVATGARPFVPPIPGLDAVEYLTSDTIWSLTELPERLVVLGGGPIGCELCQAFARLGSQVTQVEMAHQIMGREDADVAEFIKNKFEAEGITVLTGHTAKEVIVEDNKKMLKCDFNGQDVQIEFDEILLAVGRKANTKGFGLEELGISTNPDGTLKTDEKLQTNIPHIYGAGDVVGPFQFTHVAAHHAWYAAVNTLFGCFKSFKVDYSVIPWATYTDPEVARVGLNENDATEKNIPFELTRYNLDDLDRAIADSEAQGFVKVLTRPGSDKILGVTIVGTHAGNLIAEFILAMKHNLGLNKILGTIHIYPTLTEANKFTAGEWKKARKPESLLSISEKLLRRQRRG